MTTLCNFKDSELVFIFGFAYKTLIYVIRGISLGNNLLYHSKIPFTVDNLVFALNNALYKRSIDNNCYTSIPRCLFFEISIYLYKLGIGIDFKSAEMLM